MIRRSALLSRSFFAPYSTRQFASSSSSIPLSSASPRWSRFRAPIIFAVGIAFGGSVSAGKDFMSWNSAADKERKTRLLQSPRAPWWSSPMQVAHCIEEELKIKEETPHDGGVAVPNGRKEERVEERVENSVQQDESKGYAVIHRRTTEAVCNAVIGDKKGRTAHHHCHTGGMGRHYIRLISPAARRHIIRVYRLALGGIALVTAGFTCGLVCFTTDAGTTVNAGRGSARATLVLSGVFVVPVKLMTVALAALIEAFGRGINALTGGAEKGAALAAAASSLSTVTTLSLPMWAPFAGVFLTMAALALSSRWSTGSETLTSNHHEAATADNTHALSQRLGHQKRRRRVVAIRRFIFYTLSFAEGALVVPIAKALLLTNFVFLGLAATFAVVVGFTAVAMCRGTLASPSDDASAYHRRHEISVGEHTTCDLPFLFQQEEDGCDALSTGHADIIRNDADSNTERHRVLVFENVPLMKLDAFIVESIVCSGALVWGALRAISSSSSSLFFSDPSGSHCLSLGTAGSNTSPPPSSSSGSPTPFSWLFSCDVKGGSVEEGGGKNGGAAGVVGSLLLGLGGFSPIVVGAVAGAAALFVASDTTAMLDHLNTVTRGNEQQPLHVSSFFILDDDVGDADGEREDLLTEVVDAGVGLALALASVAVRFVDAVAEVSWGNDHSSSFVAGCRVLGDRCFL